MAPRKPPTAVAGASPIDFEPPNVTGEPAEQVRSNSYLRLLLVLLVSAAFFEGYDGSIVALLLPNIQSTFHVSEATLGLTRVFSVAGAFAAFFLARSSDRVGRRPLLLWSVLGYTLFTALTALSWSIWSFAFFQFCAGVFLGTEFAVAVTMIVEEYPTERRGKALGTLLTFAALGAVVVAVLLFAGLADSALEWRAFYLVGLLPLITLAFFRPRLKETQRFLDERKRRLEGAQTVETPFLEPWKPQYRRNLVLVGLVHMLRSIPLIGATSWWAYYAERERGFTAQQVAIFIGVSYGLGTFGYYVCGRLMERLGRRPTAMIYLVGGITFSMILFQTSAKPLAFVALMFAVFFGLGMGPLMSAFATELFPTAIRGQAAAWVRNWFEIAGIFFGPLLVGVLGDHTSGAIGNIGDTVTLLMVLQIPCIWILWRYMPETKGLNLEDADAPTRVVLPGSGTTISWRTFTIGLTVTVVAFASLFVGLEVANHGTHRPEGTAERWLAAISDTTRKGVHRDAVKRADKEGSADLGTVLESADAGRDGKRSFTSLEVGKATVTGNTARVPYLVHKYASSGTGPISAGVVVLRRTGSSWKVSSLGPRTASERVPSEGGKPPSSAPAIDWVVAFVVGIVVAVGCSVLINLAGRGERATAPV